MDIAMLDLLRDWLDIRRNKSNSCGVTAPSLRTAR